LPAGVPAFHYEIQSLGLNYRITDLQCALGRSQLRKLDRFAARRAEIVATYRAGLADVGALALPVIAPDAQPVWHLFTVRVLAGPEARRSLYEHLRERGILSQVHYLPVNGFPLYRSLGFDPRQTPRASQAAGQLLSLPLYPALTRDEVSRVIDVVRTWARGKRP
jgi:perosamine synthetase